MSDKCTKSGTSLWLMLDLVFISLLLIEVGYLKEALDTDPALGRDVALIGATVLFGTFASIIMLNHGLTNKLYDMGMRITLVASGAVVGVAALLTGAVLSLSLS